MRFLYVAIVLVASHISFGQKFCQHLRMMEQTTMNNSYDSRADTFNVLSYEINAEFLDYQSAKKIDATTIVRTVLLKKSNKMKLDLLKLNVRSVRLNGTLIAYDYSSPALTFDVSSIVPLDTFDVEINYWGTPKSDPQWGGFYFTGEYAFNLGVGFASDPHNFGRAWFPCFDNFTDRAIYHTNITVDSGFSAYANGYLTEKLNNGNGTETFKWTMDEEIPTYLSSVAIAAYEEVKFDVDGIPVLLTSLAKDTANLRSSFENIPQCIRRYEEAYGEHTFDRIGFNIVPFNSGAMEHATNIAYPLYAIANGDKNSETLYAHELAHHWWGNTITCRTQEDMWLNEGWASFSERLFLEAVYGRERYDEDIEDNHRQVLQFAHIQDEAVLPVSGIGHANTYGRHVYNKGADMVHSLRGMMGDEDFFEACAAFQKEFKFKDVSTNDIRDFFGEFTALSMTGFFDQWVKEPGFAHFDIPWVMKQDGVYKVHIKQTPRFNDITYRGTVATVSAFSANMERFDSQVIIFNKEQTFDVNCPFEPAFWAFDFDDRISDAVTTDWAIFKGESEVDFKHGMMNKVSVNVPEGDSALVRIEHHWAPADGTYGKPAKAQLSTQRFWTVDGVWDKNVKLSSELIYSGLQSNSLTFGYLDNKMIRITEDSLVLLYRPNAGSAWEVAKDYTKITGSLFDKRGTIAISDLKKGQYTLAMYDANLAGIKEVTEPHATFKLYPNPAKDMVNIEFAEKHDCCILEITNIQGQVVVRRKLKKKTKSKEIDVSDLPSGTYFVGLITDNLAYDIKRLIIE
ncbi:MAG: M1 family aminopeptidase [Bacteroidia bacterium]